MNISSSLRPCLWFTVVAGALWVSEPASAEMTMTDLGTLVAPPGFPHGLAPLRDDGPQQIHDTPTPPPLP